MRVLLTVLPLLLMNACAKKTVYAPSETVLNREDLNSSRDRARNLNRLERAQIQQWIARQNRPFYSMGLNYWADIENLNQRPRRADGEKVSYRYEIFDFDQVRLYPNAINVNQRILGNFEELKAVEDAVRYLKPGEKCTLLVPSVLAYGTYGDNNKIPNDMPLIIQLIMTNN